MNIHSFSPQIRKLPSFPPKPNCRRRRSSFVCLSSFLAAPITWLHLTSLRSLGSAPVPLLPHPKFDVPLSRARSPFLGRRFPPPQKRPPTRVPHATTGLFTSLFPSFYPLPSPPSLPLPPTPPYFVCYSLRLLQTSKQANLEGEA